MRWVDLGFGARGGRGVGGYIFGGAPVGEYTAFSSEGIGETIFYL
jgi:hypothetical protein